MSVDTTGDRPGGAVAAVKEKGEDVVSATQQQVSAKAHELGGEAAIHVREQLDQRSTQAGEQVQAIGHALGSGVEQLRTEGMDVPAKVVAEIAQRAEELGGYLQSARADRILGDIEGFARRRPWLTAGVGVVAGFLASRFVKASGDRRYEGAGRSGDGYAHRPQASLPAGGA